MRAGSVGVCLIDDCGDNDVPLMEMSAHGKLICMYMCLSVCLSMCRCG